MTDARLAPTFLGNPKVDNLTDVAFRIYVNAIVHCARHETDGLVARRAARLLHPDLLDLSPYVQELVRAGFWEVRPDGWQVHDFLEYQSSKAQMDAYRATQRDKKRRQRQAKKQESAPVEWPETAVPGGTGHAVPGGTPDHCPLGTPQSVPRHFIGQDRQGQARDPRPVTTTCSWCGGEMDQLEPGQWMHPNCADEADQESRRDMAPVTELRRSTR